VPERGLHDGGRDRPVVTLSVERFGDLSALARVRPLVQDYKERLGPGDLGQLLPEIFELENRIYLSGSNPCHRSSLALSLVKKNHVKSIVQYQWYLPSWTTLPLFWSRQAASSSFVWVTALGQVVSWWLSRRRTPKVVGAVVEMEETAKTIVSLFQACIPAGGCGRRGQERDGCTLVNGRWRDGKHQGFPESDCHL